MAPVMIVDGKYHDGVTSDSVRKILQGLPAGKEPAGSEVAR
jgi:NADH:ubiquinone oxidoreductase subunit E